jgi:hypothetical protein
MFYLSYLYGIIATAILLVVFFYLVLAAPARDWGEISQAIMFHQVRKYLLLLDTERLHSKFWRPNVLLVVDNPAAALIGFCNTIKKGGLLIVGQAMQGEFDTNFHLIKSLRRAWNQYLKKYKVKGFSQVTVNPSYRHSVESLMLGSGLGGLSCNTVCVPLLSTAPDMEPKTNRAAYVDTLATYLRQPESASVPSLASGSYNNLPVSSFGDFCHILHAALKVEYNLMIACNFTDGIHQHKKSNFVGLVSPKQFTDIWIIGDLAIINGLDGTAHHLWGYTNSQYQAHKAHPELVIPPPLEVEGNQESVLTNAQLGMEGLVALLIHVGAIADQTHIGANGKRQSKGHAFRIMHIPSSTSRSLDAATEREARTDFIVQVCARARFEIARENIHVFMLINVMDDVPEYHAECAKNNHNAVALNTLSQDFLVRIANTMMKRHSVNQTSTIFTILPYPQDTQDERTAEAYVRRLNTLTTGLPPTILVSNGEDVPFIVTSL